MDPLKLFYSWQSDTPSKIGRRFIEIALETACERVGAEIGRSIVVDSDTRNVPGTPPITETILGKIRDCDIFCGDMTFVARTSEGKLVPNPNVMGEYGYALYSKGLNRILLVMNTAFGSAKELPFDLHHLRHPTSFDVAANGSDPERRRRRERLADELTDYIRLIVAHLPVDTASDTIPEAAIIGASEAIESTFHRVYRHEAPALVQEPRFVVALAPFAADWSGRLAPRDVVTAMADLIPEEFSRLEEGGGSDGWWLRDPPVRPQPDLNPEARWYVRISRHGVFDAALKAAERVDNDPHIVVSGHRLEAMLVDLVDRASIALGTLGLGPSGLLSIQLLGCQDLIMTAGRRTARPFQQPSIGLGSQRVDRIGERLGDDLRQMLDGLWLAAGDRLGSPSFVRDHWAGYDGEAPYRL